jgi:hypothetical protein
MKDRLYADMVGKMALAGQAISSLFLKEFVFAFFLSMRCFFAPKKDAELPLREGPTVAPLSRRACVALLSERRGALHRLQAV